jgi:hypothetical protein
MTKKYFPTVLCIFFSFSALCQHNEDYLHYYGKIRDLENDFFERNKLDKDILVRYKTLFDEYDFVYLQDCFTALQLSVFLGDEYHFMIFIEKASKNGLSVSNINSCNYIKNSSYFARHLGEIRSLITKNRPLYLSRINTKLLQEITKIYALDQAQKNLLLGESNKDYKIRYDTSYQATFKKLLSLINEYGIPSDKLLGVDQNDLLKELSIPNADLSDYLSYYRNDYNVNNSQYFLEENWIASTLLIPIMWHGNCSYSKMRQFFSKGLKNGTIHPRDIAIIKDEDFRSVNLCKSSDSIYFNIGNEKLLNIPHGKVNYYRSINLLCSLETDSIKNIYINKYGMKLRYGFIGKR